MKKINKRRDKSTEEATSDRIDSSESLSTRLNILRELCDEEKREFSELALGFFYTGLISANPIAGEGGKRQIFTGSSSDIVSDIESFRDVGLDTMIFRMERPSLAETLELIEWFGSEIRPLL